MKENKLQVASTILSILGFVLIMGLLVFHKPWLGYCAAFCEFSTAGIQTYLYNKSKSPEEKISKKKIVIGIVAGTVLTIVAIWVVFINVLKTGLN